MSNRAEGVIRNFNTQLKKLLIPGETVILSRETINMDGSKEKHFFECILAYFDHLFIPLQRNIDNNNIQISDEIFLKLLNQHVSSGVSLSSPQIVLVLENFPWIIQNFKKNFPKII